MFITQNTLWIFQPFTARGVCCIDEQEGADLRCGNIWVGMRRGTATATRGHSVGVEGHIFYKSGGRWVDGWVSWLGRKKKERELDDCLGRPVPLSLSFLSFMSHCDLPPLSPERWIWYSNTKQRACKQFSQVRKHLELTMGIKTDWYCFQPEFWNLQTTKFYQNMCLKRLSDYNVALQYRNWQNKSVTSNLRETVVHRRSSLKLWDSRFEFCAGHECT